MVMTLALESWEIHSLRQGCNLYSKHFRICALTVHKVDEIGRRSKSYKALQDLNKTSFDVISSTTSSSVRSMYFREREKPVVDADTFLALALPKILMGCLIIFLNGLAILTLIRSNGWLRRRVYFLPSTTQGLLHSLFVTYLLLGLLTLYSQVSLGAWVLAEFRFFDDKQGQECLVVNSTLIALSVAVSLHLLSLAVDKTLASYLSYNKYSELTKGTVPLWLTAIWLPCGILGALPLAGWRESFAFCIFTEQFNADYLRFVSGFFLASIVAIPCLFLYFLAFLRRSPVLQGHQQTLYRWHRKLQTHHKLTFVTILAFNVVCWSPFHVYLLLACPSCPLSSFSSGFLLEYLFVIALLPAIAIPIMFTIRSNVLNQCAGKVARKTHTNPLSQKSSSLFFVDNSTATTTLSSTLYKDTLSSKKGAFFVPRYLPMTLPDSSSSNTQKSTNKYIKNHQRNTNSRRPGGLVGDPPGRTNEGYKAHTEEEPVYANTHTMSSSSTAKEGRGRALPPSQETDSQCGFPIKKSSRPAKAPRRLAPPPPTQPPPPPPTNQDDLHYYSTLNH